MSREVVPYLSPMQGAFINATLAHMEKNGGKASHKVARKVLKVSDKHTLKEMPAVNVRVSYRTAQKLKDQGVL
jgi:hypothetical protein